LALAATVLAALLLMAGQPRGGRAKLTTPAPDGPLVVAITDAGVTPAQATAPAGLVHLLVENRRESREALTLRVAREGGALVREIRLAEGQREAATELDLAAGTYTLSEAAHPSWSCRLTVQ
jgi:hypothetical protein